MGLFGNKKKKFPDVRIEGVAKVTGAGKYSAEYQLDKLCYGVLVGSTIAAGKITALHLDAAKEVEGVLDIITHEHRPTVPGLADEAKIKQSRVGLPVFHTDSIYFKGQPIALVLAETFEDATYAASLVTADYAATTHNVNFDSSYQAVTLSEEGKKIGDVEYWSNAPFIIEQEYTIKQEVHNPMEMHATIAHWYEEDKLKLYDKTQGVVSVQNNMSTLWGIPKTNVEVVSEFMGGGFGSGLRVWSHTIAASMAARQVKRPVKIVLTRPQMFLLVGYRPQAWQKLKIGADATGKFMGVLHQAKHGAAKYENFKEGITGISRLIYAFPNIQTQQATVPLDLSTPTWMRGPGDTTGAFALESAIDELAYLMKRDPLDLRIQNIAKEKHPDNGKPWSTNYMIECVERGAALIEWKKNWSSTPGSLSDGDWKIGYGMALGRWNANRSQAGGTIIMKADGSLVFQTAMTDIGTGTGTGVQNLTAINTGISKDRIKVELGNSKFPNAPSQGGSTGLATISDAVVATCEALKLKLAGFAATENPLYKDANVNDILLSDTAIHYKTMNAETVKFSKIWKNNNLDELTVTGSSRPFSANSKFAFASSAAHFCQVKVHSKTGKVKIVQMVSVVDGGTIVNKMAAANQVSGAAIGAIGMALSEEQLVDQRYGALVGNDFASYHFAVNADAPIINVEFIDKPDLNINPTGAKGIGEVGIIGGAPAIANAIFNATGKRMRNLPITPDKILMG